MCLTFHTRIATFHSCIAVHLPAEPHALDGRSSLLSTTLLPQMSAAPHFQQVVIKGNPAICVLSSHHSTSLAASIHEVLLQVLLLLYFLLPLHCACGAFGDEHIHELSTDSCG